MKLKSPTRAMPDKLLPWALLTCVPWLPAKAQDLLNFVPMTPCRIVDTRNANGTLGGPIINGQLSRDFPIPQSRCAVPITATAYSLNITVVPAGPLGYLTIWPTGQPQPYVSTLNAPLGQVTANAAIIGAGTNGSVSVFMSNNAHVILDINGYFLTPTNTANQNTSLGSGALAVNDSGVGNTGIGFAVLASNTAGNNNFGSGSSALNQNTTGSANTAVGSQSLWNNLIGSDNTALGYFAAWANTTGLNNVAIGANALANGSTGSGNTAIGTNALTNQTIGSWNIGVGYAAGSQINPAGSNNIDIGNTGQASDFNVIRIGSTTQTATYIAGISGTSVFPAVPVLIDSTGRLGTGVSSERFKEDIDNVGERSRALMSLRPVSFHYKNDVQSGTKALQYGLIAEEVAKIYPDMVVYDSAGRPISVQYQQIPILMLNELQRQQKTIEQQTQAIREGNERTRLLEEKLAILENMVRGLQLQDSSTLRH